MKHTATLLIASVSLTISLFSVYEVSQVRSQLSDINTKKPDTINNVVAKSDTPKLVTVDFQDIYNSYRIQSGADNELNQAVKAANEAIIAKKSELSELMENIKSKQVALQKTDLKADELEKIKAEVTEQITQAQQLNNLLNTQTQQIQANINNESTRINQRLYSDLQRIIKRKSQAKGYHYVINSQAQDLSQTPVFLYSLETTDLTGEIMTEMGLKPQSAEAAKTSPSIPQNEASASTEKTDANNQ